MVPRNSELQIYFKKKQKKKHTTLGGKEGSIKKKKDINWHKAQLQSPSLLALFTNGNTVNVKI